MMIDLQGQAAANNGMKAETKVANIIESFGGEVIQHRDFINGYYTYDTHTFLIKNKPYTNMFNGRGRGDFYLLSHKLDKPIGIEVRSQKVKGSASEKMAALFGNCLKLGTENVIIVLDGEGHDPCAVAWIKEMAEKEAAVNIRVLSLTDFSKHMTKIFEAGEV